MTEAQLSSEKKKIISFVVGEGWRGGIQVIAVNSEDLLTQIFIY